MQVVERERKIKPRRIQPAVTQDQLELVKQLYIQGLTPKGIQDRTGVKASIVSVYATRRKWKDIGARTQEVLKAHGDKDLGENIAQSLIEQSKQVRSAIALECQRDLEVIEKQKPKGIRHSAARQAVLRDLVSNADKVFSWSQQSQSSQHYNLIFLGQEPAGPIEPSVMHDTDGDVIDIESVPCSTDEPLEPSASCDIAVNAEPTGQHVQDGSKESLISGDQGVGGQAGTAGPFGAGGV